MLFIQCCPTVLYVLPISVVAYWIPVRQKAYWNIKLFVLFMVTIFEENMMKFYYWSTITIFL